MKNPQASSGEGPFRSVKSVLGKPCSRSLYAPLQEFLPRDGKGLKGSIWSPSLVSTVTIIITIHL